MSPCFCCKAVCESIPYQNQP
uniref:Uncharacterized protein n=1 Tax=Anguilla anguilla TaxID=7936 RepID=A0A0E9QLD0_ANGAN